MEKSQYLEIDMKSIQDKNFRNIYSDNHSRNIKVFNYIKNLTVSDVTTIFFKS